VSATQLSAGGAEAAGHIPKQPERPGLLARGMLVAQAMRAPPTTNGAVVEVEALGPLARMQRKALEEMAGLAPTCQRRLGPASAKVGILLAGVQAALVGVLLEPEALAAEEMPGLMARLEMPPRPTLVVVEAAEAEAPPVATAGLALS